MAKKQYGDTAFNFPFASGLFNRDADLVGVAKLLGADLTPEEATEMFDQGFIEDELASTSSALAD